MIDGIPMLPADPAAEDCSAYFQAAMDWLSFNGGGTVYVPPGHYKFTKSLTLPRGVTLRGRWVKPEPGQPVLGTIFDIYADANNATAPAFLRTQEQDTALRDLALWYPDQTPTNWVPYPWAIYGSMDVENITLVNAYKDFLPLKKVSSSPGACMAPRCRAGSSRQPALRFRAWRRCISPRTTGWGRVCPALRPMRQTRRR
ncbi:MAG: hypothetical protein HC888_19435 [Candidatus Competibacteraceae bacterium]|nr:hypothetical protein [Candidatus Competibacteraceae bacterium]